MKSIALKPLHLQLALILLAMGALYFPFIQTMIRDWDTNDNYSHGYLIPFISAFMIYTLRDELKSTPLKPANWGLLLVSLGLAQLFVAKVGSEYFLQRTSIIIVLFGIVLFLCGAGITRKIWLPLAYLIFMIPIPAIIWNRVAFPLQLFASAITEQVIQLIGMPVFREGNVLHLAQTTLEVVDACSGLRSLVTMLALGTALAFIGTLTTWKRWALFLSAVPIAILINITRLVATAIMAKWMGADAAQGFLHDFSGFFVFALGLAMLFGVQVVLSRLNKKSGTIA